MARLVWKRADGEKREFPIGEACTIGRDASLECFLGVKSVSRKHARVERRPDGYFIADLGSKNGTIVNGAAIAGERRLVPGDTVQVGDETLAFEGEGEDLAGPAATREMTAHVAATEALHHSRDPSGHLQPPGRDSMPRRCGKFYLYHRIGQGGMGAVYHALDLDSNREVAVKFIKPTIGRQEAFLDFFHQREAVLAREILHPNVIRVFEHGVEGETHYISMEYVPGKNLYHLLKERRFSPAEVLEVLRQAACGLLAAHREGVVHSDVKPANILIVSPQAVAALDGAAEEEGSEEVDDGLLEFDSDLVPPGSRAGSGGGDAALREEIRRRVGEPVREVLIDPPFFTRPAEMAFLRHYFERSLEGRGCLLLIEGDSGSGKTRLASEFLKGLAEEEIAGGCRPELFELDVSRIEGPARLYEQVFGGSPDTLSSAKDLAARLCERLAAKPAPVVLRLLNLGGLIPEAQELCASLTAMLGTSRCLLVATLEPGSRRENGWLKSFLETCVASTKGLFLRPLTEYQVQRFLQKLFKDAMPGSSLGSDLHRLTGGNVATILETLRAFFQRGVLSLDEPSGRLRYRPRAQELELEEGKRLFEKYRLQARVEQHVLEQAAFIGRTFLFDTILKLMDVNETSLFFIVRTLITEGFLAESGRTWYTFTNASFQRYLADRIPASEQPQLHRRISRLLQYVPLPESAELYQLRARHYEGCREFARAMQCLLEATHLARCDYRTELCRELVQDMIRIYRLLGRRETDRKEVIEVLREWFHRDGNWYSILGEIGSETPTARVKIADFGISFRLEDDERGYQLSRRPALGTPRYMAPERSQSDYGGFKSDVFSLGIILYEMAMGEPPFPELKGREVMKANREDKIVLSPQARSQYPPGMVQLLEGMLEKDPMRRWDCERVIREVVRLQQELRAQGARSRA